MTSSAVSGIGTVFQRWGGAAFAKLAEVFTVTGPNMTRETIDVTSFDSTGGYREFIGALRDGGTFTFSMNFTRAAYELLKTDFESDTLQVYELVLPDAEVTSFEFEGLVTELPLNVSIDDKITCDVAIKISAEVTVNSGSGSAV